MNIIITESTFYILLAVLKPNHGYGIIQKVDEITKGRVILGPGTLYGALNNLLSKKWIKLYSEETNSRKKKEYIITSLGREILDDEIIRLKELVENGEKGMREND